MSELVDQAMVLAARAHAGQLDKAGAPYIEHPGRVAVHVTRHALPEDEEAAQAVAWLHDVVEDTPVTLPDRPGRQARGSGRQHRPSSHRSARPGHPGAAGYQVRSRPHRVVRKLIEGTHSLG